MPDLKENINLIKDIEDFVSEVFPHKKQQIISQLNKKNKKAHK